MNKKKNKFLTLLEKQVKCMYSDGFEDVREVYRETFEFLRPFLTKLASAMEEKSPYKGESIWAINPLMCSRVIIESLHKQTGTITFKVGMSTGAWFSDSLSLPSTIEEMDLDDVLAWALAHDGRVVMVEMNNHFALTM